MKKFLAISLTSALVVLSACGGEPTEEDLVALSADLQCLAFDYLSDGSSSEDYLAEAQDLYDEYNFSEVEYSEKALELLSDEDFNQKVEDYLEENCESEAYLEQKELLDSIES